MGYRLQANRKPLEGSSHLDRDAQVEHIDQQVKPFQACDQPVIAVDTKKKELIGDFKNPGRELRPKDDPGRVRVHDLELPELGKVAPSGGYDQMQKVGWVPVGTAPAPRHGPSPAFGVGGTPWGSRPCSCRKSLIAATQAAWCSDFTSSRDRQSEAKIGCRPPRPEQLPEVSCRCVRPVHLLISVLTGAAAG
jgi:hypothetical protein